MMTLEEVVKQIEQIFAADLSGGKIEVIILGVPKSITDDLSCMYINDNSIGQETLYKERNTIFNTCKYMQLQIARKHIHFYIYSQAL